MPKGHPDKDDADTECATQKITTDRQQYISLSDRLSLGLESIFKTSLSWEEYEDVRGGGLGVCFGVMGLEGIGVSLLCWAFIEHLINAL